MKKFDYKRILIVGCPGAGKSSLSLEVAKKLNFPVVHLDKLYWLPDWVKRDREEFYGLMEVELLKTEWIIEGNFKSSFSHRLKYADFCIFLDYKVSVCEDGVRKRVEKYAGMSRPDMAEGCIEKEDPEFIEFVKNFRKTIRPKMIRALKNSKCAKIIFKNRKQAEKWLSKICN